jgi:hypothetical protein
MKISIAEVGRGFKGVLCAIIRRPVGIDQFACPRPIGFQLLLNEFIESKKPLLCRGFFSLYIFGDTWT